MLLNALKFSLFNEVNSLCRQIHTKSYYNFEDFMKEQTPTSRKQGWRASRVGEHRRSFYKLCDKKEIDLNSDEFALGNHLFSDHSLQNRSDFDVSLLDFASPKILDVKEHKFIHLLNSLKPSGLNIENPLSVPLLHTSIDEFSLWHFCFVLILGFVNQSLIF